MFAPSMEFVAARFRCERVHQKTAGLRVAGNYLPQSGLKVAARLLVIPGGSSVENCVVTAGRGGARPAYGSGQGSSSGVATRNLALWEAGGINFDAVFQGLHEIGFTGYFTVHSRTSQGIPPVDLATKSFAFLKPYADGLKG